MASVFDHFWIIVRCFFDIDFCIDLLSILGRFLEAFGTVFGAQILPKINIRFGPEVLLILGCFWAPFWHKFRVIVASSFGDRFVCFLEK